MLAAQHEVYDKEGSTNRSVRTSHAQRRRSRGHALVETLSCPTDAFRVHSNLFQAERTLHPAVAPIAIAPSAVGINLRPFRIDLLPLLFRCLSVGCRALQSCCAQTHVDIVLQSCAHAHGLPHKAFGLALVERGHDLFAACKIEIVR